jgi:hypothetical protein
MPTNLKALDIATLFNWSLARIFELASSDQLPIMISDASRFYSDQDRFTYPDALIIEVARQLQDDGGMPMAAASKLVWNAGIDVPPQSGDDYWIAIVRYRNTWGGSTPRGSIPVTEVGASEYWSSSHFSGSFAEVSKSIAEEIGNTATAHPDSDPARIFMANVSTADRRLRKRAAALGIQVSGD